jgi:hypothetical protein
MPIDTNHFATSLRANSESSSTDRCAHYVQLALEAAGADTTGHPPKAKDWGPTVLRNGDHTVVVENPDTFHPMEGDVVVIEPPRHGDLADHIADNDRN